MPVSAQLREKIKAKVVALEAELASLQEEQYEAGEYKYVTDEALVNQQLTLQIDRWEYQVLSEDLSKQRLDALGKEGWELISALSFSETTHNPTIFDPKQVNTVYLRLYFKRKIPRITPEILAKAKVAVPTTASRTRRQEIIKELEQLKAQLQLWDNS